MRKLLLVLLTFALYAWADPAPLGLEIGKATVQDAKARYKLRHAGINKYTSGDMYDVDPKQVDMKYLQSCRLIFDKDGRLMAVVMTFYGNDFDYYYELLSEKYKPVESYKPFVGDKEAKFVDGDTEIILEAPHLSFTMTLLYAHKNFLKKAKEQSQQEEEQERRRTKQSL
ncbi:MAG: hypothetical protein ABWU22_05495 [Aquificaceae bacterium]